jgi:hypothetical protein
MNDLSFLTSNNARPFLTGQPLDANPPRISVLTDSIVLAVPRGIDQTDSVQVLGPAGMLYFAMVKAQSSSSFSVIQGAPRGGELHYPPHTNNNGIFIYLFYLGIIIYKKNI